MLELKKNEGFLSKEERDDVVKKALTESKEPGAKSAIAIMMDSVLEKHDEMLEKKEQEKNLEVTLDVAVKDTGNANETIAAVAAKVGERLNQVLGGEEPKGSALPGEPDQYGFHNENSYLGMAERYHVYQAEICQIRVAAIGRGYLTPQERDRMHKLAEMISKFHKDVIAVFNKIDDDSTLMDHLAAEKAKKEAEAAAKAQQQAPKVETVQATEISPPWVEKINNQSKGVPPSEGMKGLQLLTPVQTEDAVKK